MSQHPLLQKLAGVADLAEADRKVLVDAASLHVRNLPQDSGVVLEGEEAPECQVLLEGLAFRYKILPEGKRQITGFVIPGDVIGLSGMMLKRTDHGVQTLTPSRVARLQRNTVLNLAANFPAVATALWQESLIEASIAREWVANVGRRSAPQRLAHLFCEMYTRLQAIGKTLDGRFEWPVTQAEIADAIGLSAVHVNRALNDLRSKGLVEVSGHHVTILDYGGLEWIGEFSPDYLYLQSGT